MWVWAIKSETAFPVVFQRQFILNWLKHDRRQNGFFDLNCKTFFFLWLGLIHKFFFFIHIDIHSFFLISSIHIVSLQGYFCWKCHCLSLIPIQFNSNWICQYWSILAGLQSIQMCFDSSFISLPNIYSEHKERDKIKTEIRKKVSWLFFHRLSHALKSISLNLHDYLLIEKLDKIFAMLCFKVKHWFARFIYFRTFVSKSLVEFIKMIITPMLIRFRTSTRRKSWPNMDINNIIK